MSEETRIEVTMSKELYEKAVKKAEEAGFKDLNEFIVFLIEQVVEEGGEEVFSKEEEEEVKERLRSLGYID